MTDTQEVLQHRGTQDFVVNLAEFRETTEKDLIDVATIVDSEEEILAKIKAYTQLTYVIAVAAAMVTATLYPNLRYVKNILGAQPAEYILFRSYVSLPWTTKPFIAYFEDTINLFRYRIKAWMIIASMISGGACIVIYMTKPMLGMFTLLFGLMNLGAVMHDCIAQGLTINILNLHKQLAELRATRNDASITAEDLLIEVKEGETEGKKAYGNYVLIRYIMRAAVTFIGGLTADRVDMGYFYGVSSVIQVGIVLFTLLGFIEAASPTWMTPNSNLFSNISRLLAVIFSLDMLLPIIFMFLIMVNPNINDIGTYILTNLDKWTSVDLSLNHLIASVTFFVSMMYLVNVAKGLTFNVQMLIAVSGCCIYNLINLRFMFHEDLSFPVMFGLTMVHSFTASVSIDFLLIPIVGRFSTKCPQGLEAFGTTTIAAIMNFSGVAGGIVASKITTFYGIEGNNYENLLYPSVISYGMAFCTLLLTPILGK